MLPIAGKDRLIRVCGLLGRTAVLLRRRCLLQVRTYMMCEDSSSDDDYMSDKFLNPPTQPKPGLLNVRSVQQHRVALERAHSSKSISREKQMELSRDKGLNTKIGEENVGFKLMMKMGFKPSGGLGKHAEGRSEPIPIEIIDGRAGLGLHNIHQKRIRLKEQRQHKMEAFQHQFRDSMAARFKMEKAQRQLNAARGICKRLDLSQNREKPTSDDFWPPDDIKAQLLAQSSLIRKEVCRSNRPKYHKRLRSASPDHLKREETIESLASGYESPEAPASSSDDELCDIDAAQHGPVEKRPDEILLRLSLYLRETHFYCFWCGAQYAGYSALASNCPGPSEDDHG
ncbi:hypothetical protein AAHC03_010094 [Spirometra sp. Aus1]